MTSRPVPIEHEKNLYESAAFIRSRIPSKPAVALILGSGLGSFADTLTASSSIATADIPHYPRSTVEGHAGRWVFGLLEGREVLAMAGRVHYYEGYSMQQVVYPVRLMGQMGIRSLIVTNAAGAVNRTFSPGDLMFITSHINFLFDNPLRGPNHESLGPRFPDMAGDYDPDYIRDAEAAAVRLGIRTQRGVYCANPGPTYETVAEVRMFQRLGADAVGMSTVPEVIVAKHQGMRVLGISCITNLGTGISFTPLSHEEVTITANRVKDSFHRLLVEVIRCS